MRPYRFAGVVCAIALAVAPSSTRATPLDFIPVGDPIEDELRVLDVLGSTDSLAHLGIRPLQVAELPSFTDSARGTAAAITETRLRRALANDRAYADPVPGRSPRLFQRSYPDDQRVESSAALEGSGAAARGRGPDFTSPSGLHVRLGAQVDRWSLHTHLLVGHVTQGLRFAPPVLGHNDAVLHSEEAYLGYTGAGARWSMQLGRSRWHWGPGEDAGLLLSKTSAPLTGMAFHFGIRPLHADGTILSATIDQISHQQLAAHRLEWQPSSGVRLGIAEAVRYRSERWEPLYAIGVLPYALGQNLLVHDGPDSVAALRNNVQAAVDAAVRLAPGQRVYAELLIDDLRTNDAAIVSKYGYLAGWESAISAFGRVTWGLELSRLTRFVYTSSFGEPFTAQGIPLGDPDGPDSRRVRLRAAWDTSVAWQVFGLASRTDLGESGLGRTFHPGDPYEKVDRFLGVVEHTTQAELGIRWWPAAGIDVATGAVFRRIDNADHVAGARHIEPGGELRLRLVR
jgi:hypothetical protein